ncbi:glutamate synthase (NADPH/NADH) large chain [Spirochaetota bacterium]|nr:glutamate synthase (NADPH/NADH) large chain [Spirochaetota bacterium]
MNLKTSKSPTSLPTYNGRSLKSTPHTTIRPTFHANSATLLKKEPKKKLPSSPTTQDDAPGMYHPTFEHDACGTGLICHTHNISSHALIKDGIECLNNLNHRGAVGSEKNSGDGAGILFKVPHQFLKKETASHNIRLGAESSYGIGQCFLPQATSARSLIKKTIEKIIAKRNLTLLGWRPVPTDNSSLGVSAKLREPVIEQLFIARPDHLTAPETDLDFERMLFIVRRIIELTIPTLPAFKEKPSVLEPFAIISLSANRIIYKGQLIPYQLQRYFIDLSDKTLASPYVIFHSRFSTNTFPSWPLAHPYRHLAHNGEINTLRGNVNWMRARNSEFESQFISPKDMKAILPLIDRTASDSACLDNALELLLVTGRSLPHALMMLMPEAWEQDPTLPSEHRNFFEYHATFMEPWDGPAALCVTDGIRYIGGILDRNGLRPARYTIYKDGVLVLGSETGILRRPDTDIVKKGRLEPGKMLLADLKTKQIYNDNEIKEKIVHNAPYGEWLKRKIPLKNVTQPNLKRQPPLDRTRKRQIAFGYSEEELRVILSPMIFSGAEPVGSMGSDTPLAVLSDQAHNLFNYFYQLFAQVTNPPIDSIRENSFMSLLTFIGPQANLLNATKDHAHVIELPHPILTYSQIEKLRWIDESNFQAKTLHTLFKYDANDKKRGKKLAQALTRLQRDAEEAIDDGYKIILLSDRYMDSLHPPIPSLLAVSSVHHYLVRRGKRSQVSLVVESGGVREVHHFAVLLGFGANAICPYTALDTIRIILAENIISSEQPHATSKITYAQAEKNYIAAVNKGLLKVISKMGISTIRSYIGSQLFEAVGIAKELIDEHFTGTISRMGGIGLKEIEQETLLRHSQAYKRSPAKGKTPDQFVLELGGQYLWRQRGEKHLFAPMIIHNLQKAVRTHDHTAYQAYAEMVNNQQTSHFTLRGLLDFDTSTPNQSISIDEVESETEIMKRFATGAMSYGSISWEAHTTLALAMNTIGGKSNTGEGGEDPIRYHPLPSGASIRSAIKQIASGRFGVTPLYLTNANELQIKIAQGAKPGEGGQLPAHKVDVTIARVRHSTPGVGLISPPPHHDIYSIEDLAQLIYDLKSANNQARVSVKLVSATGVGTIAAGVVKGYADHVVIAGFDGGTGASPLTSIKHAGLPWELGLSETQQTLVKNNLRSRVTLQTDGQIKTGRDIAIAALLGAEEWGVASAALVALGCIMMRKCHLNTCPVGIATQREDLRALFTGKAQHAIRLFSFLAQELRTIMAQLGFKTVTEMIGRTDKLKPIPTKHWKAHTIDWNKLLYRDNPPIIKNIKNHPPTAKTTAYCSLAQDKIIKRSSDWEFVKKIEPALKTWKPTPPHKKQQHSPSPKFVFTKTINNTERSFGTLLSHKLTHHLGEKPLKKNSITFHLKGSAGQSFAAFSIAGIHYQLEGEANDYFAKGLAGSTIAVYPPRQATLLPENNIIIGNVAFYGATSGTAYINGSAGERFCVRNSGAHVVIEDVGAHGCEYMTGGRVIILGSIQKNFAAGMSGGIAYIYKPARSTPDLINTASIQIEDLNEEDMLYIKKQLAVHKNLTQSNKAKTILKHWETTAEQFIKIMPIDYKRALMKQNAPSPAPPRLKNNSHTQPLFIPSMVTNN